MAQFSVHTLGCGSAKPTPRHQPSCTVVDFRDNLFMVDCGEGAQLAMMKKRLRMSRLGHIFLTHLHGDHVFGIFGLIGTLGLHSAGGSITIHTFAEGKEIISRTLNYFSANLPFEVKYNILDPTKEQIAFESKSLRVRTIPLAHRVPAVGYIFEEKPGLRHINREMCDFHGVPFSQYGNLKNGMDFTKEDGTLIPNSILTKDPTPALTYAHISDTSYLPSIAPKLGNPTLLFHETTYLDINEKEARERGHSTAREAARIAKASGAKWLLTGHYSSRYSDDEGFRKEATEEFPNVILAREGLTTDLTRL
ncbi:MAG: ribonuclease Z [Muribaculaceae bacterium]|nr:ribonuclease Z [Muribaculaceae bacterium]